MANSVEFAYKERRTKPMSNKQVRSNKVGKFKSVDYKCLSIAGFDSSGGAGIQADLKTFSAFGCYGMTVLTALPIQNTCGVTTCFDIPASIVHEQLIVIFQDIIPDSIKIGMLYSAEIIEVVADFLKVKAPNIPIILDPVMLSKSRDPLLKLESLEILKRKLIPLATILTPNLDEAYLLVGDKINDYINLAEKILQLNPQSVLLKGGHAPDSISSNDLFLSKQGTMKWLHAPRVNTKNTHGTGCSLSSAICACLARGFSALEACEIAKYYIFEAIKSAKNKPIGNGAGPIDHFFHLEPLITKYLDELTI